MNQQQQQGLPAQGMQMGHIPPLNPQHMMMQRQQAQQQRQHQSQTQQHSQTHAQQQQQQQPAQQTQPAQPAQQQQQHHIQDTVRLQMQKQMMQSRGHPPNYPMSQAQSINNAMNQRGMMQNVSLNFSHSFLCQVLLLLVMTNCWILFLLSYSKMTHSSKNN